LLCWALYVRRHRRPAPPMPRIVCSAATTGAAHEITRRIDREIGAPSCSSPRGAAVALARARRRHAREGVQRRGGPRRGAAFLEIASCFWLAFYGLGKRFADCAGPKRLRVNYLGKLTLFFTDN